MKIRRSQVGVGRSLRDREYLPIRLNPGGVPDRPKATDHWRPLSRARRPIRSDTFWFSIRRSMVFVSLGGFLALFGCRREVQMPTAKAEVEARAHALSERNELEAALGFLKEYDRYQQATTQGRVLHHLRKWTEDKLPDSDWIADPLFGRLPERLGISKNPGMLARIDFDPQDIAMLREATWLRDLATRLANGPLVPEYEAWIEQQVTLSSIDRQALGTFLTICDWTIRNVQIEPLELQAAELGGEKVPAIRPGVRRSAWEALLTGRGDAACRGRLIILLCRQVEIPVVALAFDAAAEPAPWAVAALINEQLYLFDPQWGLPIPATQEEGIATLQQILEEPGLVRQLDVNGEPPYPLADEELKSIVALIDATPQYLSQRMRLLELALPTTEKLVLTTSPSSLRQQLENVRGIKRVAIWTQPYDVDRFRAMDIAKYPVLVQQLNQDLAAFSPPWPLAFARGQHVRGIFTDAEYHEGAKELYLKARLSDARIDGVNTAQELQSLLDSLFGLGNQVPEDADVVKGLMQMTRTILLATRGAASWGLGNIALESDDNQVAVDYFDKRLISFEKDETWRVGAWYNLGRAYEGLARTTNQPKWLRNARECYLRAPDSPQQGGNLVRARRLENRP